MITYLSGIALEKVDDRRTTAKKVIVGLSFAFNLSILFFYKYANFAVDILNKVLIGVRMQCEEIPHFNVLLPVGISFFTFQALSYTMDVYRDETKAEKNFLRYALYVSFFPQLVAGPIERSKTLLKQLSETSRFEFNKARDGLLLMLWGYFLKIVIADRIGVVVDTVYSECQLYNGWYLIVATILFAFQIYCDFAGYSTIAIGAAEILGIKLMENFDAPYTAQTVSEFWRRWHISLTSWFRDYLYIPLGGNRKGRFRRGVNILTVFLVSGLWHGAGLHYVAWGGINGIFQIIGDSMIPFKHKIIRILKLNPMSLGFKLYKAIVTFVLIDLSWVYFRAESFSKANAIVKSVFTANNPWILFDGSLYNLGLNEKNFHVMLGGILLLIISDLLKRKGICIREIIAEQDYIFRWVFISTVVIMLLIFGIWGSNYAASGFIYFQF